MAEVIDPRFLRPMETVPDSWMRIFGTCSSGDIRADGKTLKDGSTFGTYRAEQPGRCVDLNGTNQRIDIGDTSQNIQAISFWVQADDITSHTDGVLQLTSSDQVQIVNGTVTLVGFSGHTTSIRVNDTASAVINNTTSFHFVYIETDTAIDLDDFDIGWDGTNYLDGKIFDVTVYSAAITSAEQTNILTQGTNPESFKSDQPTGYVGRWLLDDNSTTTARDSSGNANNGTIQNYASGLIYENSAVPYSMQNLKGYSDSGSEKLPIVLSTGLDTAGSAPDYTGRVPRDGQLVESPCLEMDGSGDYVEVPDDDSFSFGDGASTDSAFSIRARVRYNGHSSAKGGLVSKSDDASIGNVEWRFTTFTSGEVALVLYDSSNVVYIQSKSTTGLSTGQDYDVVATYDGSATVGGITIYVNGAAVAMTTASNGSYAAMHPTNNTVRIGDDLWSGAFRRTLDGKIWDVSIWNKELSAAEVLYLYDGTGTGPDTSTDLIEHWPISEGVGAKVYGTKELADGDITNATWSTQDEFHYSIVNGFSLYEHASLGDLYSPIVLSSPPTGYTLTATYSAGGFLPSGTKIDFRPVETSPDLRNYSVPGDGVVANYAFDGNIGDGTIETNTAAKEAGFYFVGIMLVAGFFNIYLGLGSSAHKTAIGKHLDRVEADVQGLSELVAADESTVENSFGPDHGFYYFAFGDWSNNIYQPAIMSRWPITASGTVDSTNPANEFIRPPVWADITVRGKSYRFYCCHTESMCYDAADCDATGKEIVQWTRAVEWVRMTAHIEAFVAANPGVPVILMGDLNDDIDRTQPSSFSSQPSGSVWNGAGGFVLGTDFTHPVDYGPYPDTQAAAAGMRLDSATNIDGDDSTIWTTTPNAAFSDPWKIDYMMVRNCTFAGSEILDSEATQTGGLKKPGATMASGDSRTASDHKMIFGRIRA